MVDGIVGGEGMGPLEPDAKPCGCLIAGEHPLAVDLVATRLMGFDPRKLRQFDVGFQRDWNFGIDSLRDIVVKKAGQDSPLMDFFSTENREKYFSFNPHPGWVGRVEI